MTRPARIKAAMIKAVMTSFARLRRRPVPALTAAAALAAALIGVGVHQAYPRTRVPDESGQAWVASTGIGALTLLDGVAGKAVANVAVSTAGDPLAAGQAAAAGFALNGHTGQVVRVDGVTLAALTSAGAGGSARLFTGAALLYLVDAATDRVDAYTAADLAPVGAGSRFAAGGDGYSAVVDTADRLWLVDTVTGALTWYAGATAHRGPVGFPAGTTLTVAAGTPVAMDTAAGRAYPLDATGRPRTTLRLGLTASDAITVDAAPGTLLVTSAERGVYETCPLTADMCSRSIQLPVGGADRLGPAVAAYGKVFIPDYSSGDAWVVDPAARALPYRLALLPAGDFDLFARNGLVFYNDPGSNRAGTIGPDGAVHPIVKYATTTPSAAANPSPVTSEAPTSPPTTKSPGTPGAGTPGGDRPTGTPSGTASSSPSTGPAGPSCGQTVTASVTLTSNLTCSGAGLVIGADQVTIDLNGHTLSGSSGAGVTVGTRTAVAGARVTNGTVSGFPDGIRVGPGGASGLTVTGVAIQGASTGINLGTTKVHNLVLNNVMVSGAANAGFLSDEGGLSGTLQVSGSTFTHAGFELTGADGTSLTGSFTGDSFNSTDLTLKYTDGITVRNGTFVDSVIQDMCDGFDGNTFIGNRFQGTTAYGMEISDMTNDRIENNRFDGQLWGIKVDLHRGTGTTVISGNTFTNLGNFGLLVNNDASGGLHVQVSDNTASGNGTRSGGLMDDGHNVAQGGIHIWAPNGGVTLTGNHTSGDSGYGIWSNPGGATGTGNTASDGCQPTTLCA